MKIGVSSLTDSFTPRMFSVMRKTIVANSAGSFQVSSESGRKLKMASPPEAIDVVIVRT